MVGYDLNDGSIFNYIMDTQNPWAVYNMVPVLALDVYEHAYVRDDGATPDGRKQYVEAFFHNVDRDHVNRQLTEAEAAKQGADSAQAHEKLAVGGPRESKSCSPVSGGEATSSSAAVTSSSGAALS